MAGAMQGVVSQRGHVLGSAQIRLESEGEVWVVSGDYKRMTTSCEPFEPVRCDVLITEATLECRSIAGRAVSR